jgi:hypothetical protein
MSPGNRCIGKGGGGLNLVRGSGGGKGSEMGIGGLMENASMGGGVGCLNSFSLITESYSCLRFGGTVLGSRILP